jgi:sugar phosphate isomerase/epimerase
MTRKAEDALFPAGRLGVKGTFPFRIGCTSYVLPDEILPNVAFMADKVDDIELVLFESREASNLPDSSTVSLLRRIARENDLTYSVHFPIDRRAGAESVEERNKFFDSVTGIIRLTQRLPVSGYVLHLEGLKDESDPYQVDAWRQRTGEFCQRLADGLLVDPKSICVENLGYAPELHRRVVEKCRFSNCIDIGHLWLYGADWIEHIGRVIDSTRIIHLHGVSGGKDHLSLAVHAKPSQLRKLASMLYQYSGVLTLEVFREKDTFSSLAIFKELWHRSA